MRARSIFIRVKNYVGAQGYTITQIQNVTPAQVKSLLSLTDDEYIQYQKYADGIKRVLIGELQAVIDQETFIDLKQQIHSWLLTRFPNYKAEKDFSNKANRTVTFYLDGKDE